MNNFDPHRYTISIKLVTLEEGEHYEALVAELPDLVEYGETYDKAYSLAVDSITMLNEAASEQGRMFPEPMPSRALEDFSGRVTLRMSKSLHANTSKLADREGVSLNSWIVEAISARVGAVYSSWVLEQGGAQVGHSNVVNRVGANPNSSIVGTISPLAGEMADAFTSYYTARTFNVIPELILEGLINVTPSEILKTNLVTSDQVFQFKGTSMLMSTGENGSPIRMQ